MIYMIILLAMLAAPPVLPAVARTDMVNIILISAPFWLIFSHFYSIKCILHLRAPRTSPRPALIILSSYLISQIISNIDCGDTWHNLACPMIATPRVPLWVRRSHSSLSTGSQACSSIKAQIFREVDPS